jgi:hypothetical protein
MMIKKAVFIVICCFLVITFINPLSATEDLPEEQPDPETADFHLAPGEIMIDDYTIPPTITASSQSMIIDTTDSNSKIYANKVDFQDLKGLHGSEGLETLASYIQQNFNHNIGAATTYTGVIATGYGDCWGLSDFAVHILVKNGYKVRLIQGTTSQANNHRWLEVQLEDGSWTTFDPSMVTTKYNCKPYNYQCGHQTTVLEVYG